jgi:hypothetical protein
MLGEQIKNMNRNNPQRGQKKSLPDCKRAPVAKNGTPAAVLDVTR